MQIAMKKTEKIVTIYYSNYLISHDENIFVKDLLDYVKTTTKAFKLSSKK